MNIIQILDSHHQSQRTITDFLSFNQIDHVKVDTWNDEKKIHDYSKINTAEPVLIIIPCSSLPPSARYLGPADKNHYGATSPQAESLSILLKLFLSDKTKIFCSMDVDSYILASHRREFIEYLDGVIPKNKMTIMIDGMPYGSNHWMFQLKNIRIVIQQPNFFMKMPRIKHASLIKNIDSKDFLLTACKKLNRPHREMLWTEICSRPGLVKNAHAYYKPRDTEKWVGERPHQHAWYDGFPSMDLYNDSFLEIVPETLHDTALFFTEKTAKPIASKTPFLMVAAQGYLKYLRSLGFQTFGSLIDESYDNHPSIEDRVKSLIDVLESIIKNGSRNFYEISKPILDHNHARLCEISGGWDYHMDLLLKTELDLLVDQK